MSARDLTDTDVRIAKRQLLIGELADQGGSIRGISETTGFSEHIVRADMAAMGFPVDVCTRGHSLMGQGADRDGRMRCKVCRAERYLREKAAS